MSKETIWTLRPPEDIEKYVTHTTTHLDMKRTDFFIACIRLAGPVITSDPSLAEKLKTPDLGCP